MQRPVKCKLIILSLLLILPSFPLWALESSSANLTDTVTKIVENERVAALHRDAFLFDSYEKSDRTGQHLWTERNIETKDGRLRYLLAEDGQPLGQERRSEELERLKKIVADPSAFAKTEQERKKDEQRAQQMLELLPHGFLFTSPGMQGDWLRIDFRPDPNYHPASIEERIAHGMTGYMLADPHELRVHHLEGRLADDVSIGFGILATVHAGSSFALTRDLVAPGQWKTTQIDTNIQGRIIFFKTIARYQHTVHNNFHHLPTYPSVADAFRLLTQ